MSRPRRTAEQKRELVLEYLAVPHGQKSKWLQERDVDPRAFFNWRRQLVTGALETGMIPRGGVWVSVEENKELGRLYLENKELRSQLDEAKKERESQARVVDALGKAIELLRDGTASKGEETQEGRP